MVYEANIRFELKRLVEDLVAGNYRAIVADGRGGHCDEEDLQAAVEEYGGKLTMPPEEAFEKLDVVKKTHREVATFHVIFTMWVDGEPSDLTLESLVVFKDSEEATICVEGLHIL